MRRYRIWMPDSGNCGMRGGCWKERRTPACLLAAVCAPTSCLYAHRRHLFAWDYGRRDEVHGGSPVESSDYSRTFESHYIYCARVVSFAALLRDFINSDWTHTCIALRMVALVTHVLIMHMCLCVFKSCCRPFSFHASRPVCRFSFICIFGDLVIKITR